MKKMPEDIIEIKQLKLELIIGNNPWERMVPQPIYIDIRFPVHADIIAQTDDLTATIDYDAMVEFLTDFCASNKPKLIETCAHLMATQLQSNFNLSWIQLTLHKKHAVNKAQDICIEVKRYKDV